jgi:hypothetical protein
MDGFESLEVVPCVDNGSFLWISFLVTGVLEIFALSAVMAFWSFKCLNPFIID